MGQIMKSSTTWVVGVLAAGIAIYIFNQNKNAKQINLSNAVAGIRG